MSESRPAKKSAKPKATSVRRPVSQQPKSSQPSPSWYAPIMVGLMLAGLVWVVVFYLTMGRFPIQGLGHWNLGVGGGLALVGFLMMTNWR